MVPAYDNSAYKDSINIDKNSGKKTKFTKACDENGARGSILRLCSDGGCDSTVSGRPMWPIKHGGVRRCLMFGLTLAVGA